MKSGRWGFLLPVILASGCASRYVGYQGPERPRSQIAVVRLDPTSDRLKFGSIDGVALPKSVHQVRVLPGTHSIGLRGFSEQGAPFGITVLAPQEASLSVDVQAGHRYIVKATGTNIGQIRFAPWIEDKATGQVVAGKKSYGSKY